LRLVRVGGPPGDTQGPAFRLVLRALAGSTREETKAVQIYIALRDSSEPQSFVIGAFSTEFRAETACQEHDDDIAEGWERPKCTLAWKDAEATTASGDHYAVVLVDLDVAV
jgi:hypothetical protein